MKFVFLLVFCFALFYKSNSQKPNVFEFCTALLSENTPRGSCEQGRPGKRGNDGRRGPIGPKGPKGDEGTCEKLENKVNAQQNFIIGLMRITAYALDEQCGMGMKSDEIPDGAVTSSSRYGSSYAAYHGRIDHSSEWIARPSSLGQWIQIDLGTSKSISGVITQGRYNRDQWIMSFKIHCGDQPNNLAAIYENGSVKIFDANTDRNTKVTNKFPAPVMCRYIRLYPETWRDHISMRMELRVIVNFCELLCFAWVSKKYQFCFCFGVVLKRSITCDLIFAGYYVIFKYI